MKEINEELRYKLSMSNRGLKPCKWNEIYDTKEEIIEDMNRILIDKNKPVYMLPKGYEYISSFQRQLDNGKELTDKQLVQLTRLASSIAYHIYCTRYFTSRTEPDLEL